MGERGYTVLETFVVVALIALIVIGFFFLTEDARARGRDAKRSEAIAEIGKALALYQTSYQRYPTTAGVIALTGSDPVSVALIDSKTISAVHADPKHPALDYRYQSDGSTYTLQFCMETSGVKGYVKGCDNSVTP